MPILMRCTAFFVRHAWLDFVWSRLRALPLPRWEIVYSKAPIFTVKPPGYQERAYDVYTYLGAHLTPCVDINSRFEWYLDVDGRGYPGGFGRGRNNNFFAVTVGPDYHPTKWLQVRPEIRYDNASNPSFGRNLDQRDQLSLALEVLLKF